MTPEWFLNFRISTAVKTGGSGLAHESGPGALANSVMGRLLNVVHAIGARQSIAFAAAFPLARQGSSPHPGNLLRVFVSSREDADSLLDSLEAHEFLMGYIVLDRPRKVPSDVAGSVSYQLHRITSRKNNNSITRQRQIERGNSLPYVRMFSSGGEAFSLRFEGVSRPEAADSECEANGYGLSTRSKPFYLPAVPVEIAPWAAAARDQEIAAE